MLTYRCFSTKLFHLKYLILNTNQALIYLRSLVIRLQYNAAVVKSVFFFIRFANKFMFSQLLRKLLNVMRYIDTHIY